MCHGPEGGVDKISAACGGGVYDGCNRGLRKRVGWSHCAGMQAVLDYLKANESRFLEELKEYVGFPSVSAQSQHRGDVKACAEWLAGHCRALGLRVEVCKTTGNEVVVARTPKRRGRRPQVLVYGHYDVQPAEPLELWSTPAFEATVVGRRLMGRGAADNKGQHFSHLKAVEAFLATGTELPCDLTFVVEGEEEVGSGGLADLLRRRAKDLKCDCVVISDTGMPSLQLPALTYALRGIAAFELELTGPSRDLHSGIYGGSVENPAMVLSRILAGMVDARGRVKVPGFYDGVQPVSRFEREQMKRLPHDDGKYAKFLGVRALAGEAGYTTEERRTARPTFEINGLTSGYQGEGSKTIVPSWARAKVTMRLVPGQDPAKILRSVKAYLKKVCPPTVRMKLTPGHGAQPYWVSPTGPLAGAALEALEAGFGKKPVLIREGGSIPIVVDFKRALGADSLLLGLALPDANAHSPNESFHLDAMAGGMRMSAHLWPALGRALAKP
jgi:acetylornithine deacetylase/succinyl-diaminopimelate desuccinylase-like protein